jgi:hypothetical protein
MRSRFDIYAALGVLAVAITRFLFRSHLLYDLDSVNFALSLGRFDPASHQPHPPGYFLYVCLGRFVNHFLRDANTALVAISIAASCGALWMIYCLTDEWFGRGPARTAMLLFLFSPLCWFHGIVALVYIVEAFFSALIGYLCWQAWSGKTTFVVPAAVAFAVAAGFRPSTAMLLGPLWILMLSRLSWFRRWTAIVAAGVTVLAWFWPMAAQAGGIGSYFAALGHLWSSVPGQRTTLSSPWLAVARILTIGWIFVLCFGSAAAFAFRKVEDGSAQRRDRVRFTWTWITPGLFFFGFVFLNFVNSGYLLVLTPPLFAFLATRVYGFIAAPGPKALRWTALAAGTAANCAFFAFAPLYCSYNSVHLFEREMSALARDFRANLDPGTTLIVGFDSHFLGYRHAGYYLPDYVTAQYPEVGYSDGKRVFAMHDRDTRVLTRFPSGKFEQFVFFPLPEGQQYAAYLDGVKAKLPAGVLHTFVVGGRNVLVGPVSAIPILFSSTAGN